jgi:hypothetical protein
MKQTEMMVEGMTMLVPSKAGVRGVTRVTDQAKTLKSLGIRHVTPTKIISYIRCNLAAPCNAKSPSPACWPMRMLSQVKANRGFGANCRGVGEC